MKKMDFLIEFIVTTVLVGFIFAAVFAVEVPAGTVSALVGEDTVLPCQLNPGRIAVGMKVRWSRDGSEAPVLCYQRGEEVTEAQHEDYRHRAQLPEAELSRGNVSLLLSSTRVTDQGTYTCSVSTQSRSQQAAVQLQLTAKGSPPSVSLLEAPARGGHCLLCVSEGWYPPPELLWTDERGSDWTAHFNSTEELDSRGLVTVRSQIHLPWQQGHAPQQQNTITCVVRSKDGQIELKAAFSDSSFSVEVPVALVSARVGDTVTLPCRLSPLSSAVLMEVRWFREGVKAPVYFYTLQKAMTRVQSEEYRDRTRLFMEELRNGNLSLQLDNTQTSDSGLYKCSVSYNLKEAEAFVELKVAASVQNEKQTLNEGCESCKKLDSELQLYKEASVQNEKQTLNEASVQNEKQTLNEGCESCKKLGLCPDYGKFLIIAGESIGSCGSDAPTVEVTLPPDPANRSLTVSKNRLITFVGEKSAEWPSLRGNEGFTSGRHYWEVKVGEKGYWALGVSTHPDEKIIPEKPEEGYWFLRLGGGKYEAVSQSIVTITLPGKKKLEKVGVCLDYDEKKIAFYNVVNAKTRFHIHSIEGGLSGQVYPIFSPGSHDGDPLIIVNVKHHNK
ncbi:UNVERIFIED_CONTAM: hypothetical protein FKN15_044107 [Acipenser sinensis]